MLGEQVGIATIVCLRSLPRCHAVFDYTPPLSHTSAHTAVIAYSADTERTIVCGDRRHSRLGPFEYSLQRVQVFAITVHCMWRERERERVAERRCAMYNSVSTEGHASTISQVGAAPSGGLATNTHSRTNVKEHSHLSHSLIQTGPYTYPHTYTHHWTIGPLDAQRRRR